MVKNINTKSYQMKAKRTAARKALKLWREIVWRRSKGCCEACGLHHGTPVEKIAKGGGIVIRKLYLNAHHVEDKGNYALRFDPENGVMLCPACHKYSPNSAHLSPLWFIDWFRKTKGEGRYVYLFLRRDGRALPVKWNCWSLDLLEHRIAVLEKELISLPKI